jgi:hypothetical protein
MLLQDADLWHALTGADHDLLTGLPTWHGALFRWLDRQLTEHGHCPWPALRDEMAEEPFAHSARDLVDGADLLVTPDVEELRSAVQQLARALEQRESWRVLGRA